MTTSIKKLSFIFFLFLSALFIFVSFVKPIDNVDVWWHLATGRWIMEHGQVPHFDPFPFAQEQIPWSAEHQWLGSTLLYVIFKAGGLQGLKSFAAIYYLCVIGLFARFSFRRLPPAFAVFACILLYLVILHRSILRPDMFNYVFIQIFLINLFAYQESKQSWRIFILIPLGMFWSNIHIGSFVYGLPLIAIFLLSAGVSRQLKEAKELGVVLILFLAALFITPYGMEGFLFPFKAFLSSDSAFRNMAGNIIETQSPGYIFLHPIKWWYYFALCGLASVLIFFNQNRKFILTALFTVSLFAFLYMARNSVFFAITTVYVIVEAAKGLRYPRHKVLEIIFLLGVLGLGAWQSNKIWNWQDVHFVKPMKYIELLEDPYEKQAIQLLIDHDISGPVFCDDATGSRLLWTGYPKLIPLEDSRHMDLERFNNRMAVLSEPEKFWSLAEVRYGFKIAILNTVNNRRSTENLARHLQNDPAWQLIYVGGSYLVFVKKDAFQMPVELAQFQNTLQSKQSSSSKIAEMKALALERPLTNRRFVEIDYFSDAMTYELLGYREAAIESFIKGFKIENDPVAQKAVLAI